MIFLNNQAILLLKMLLNFYFMFKIDIEKKGLEIFKFRYI